MDEIADLCGYRLHALPRLGGHAQCFYGLCQAVWVSLCDARICHRLADRLRWRRDSSPVAFVIPSPNATRHSYRKRKNWQLRLPITEINTHNDCNIQTFQAQI